MERLDALSVRESNGKSYFTKIGAAFPNKDGKGFSVLLDAIPASVDGQYKIMLRTPLPKDGDRQQRSSNSRSDDWGSDSFDDGRF
ncbi:hypothetical protein [Novosphingobium sp. HII-3]|uniref:hypothetical protein n=1 Tax=Novosphingobium sp. HII-3 TaxID=2075565 RepID=UPI000CDA9082|nr:hypothetical protein [Novosphingobium sp. HII-3]